MIEEAPRFGDLAAIIFGALGIAIIVYSIILRRNIVVFAVGAVIVAAAFASPIVIRGAPVFVLVVRETGDTIEILERSGFYGGSYTGQNGKVVNVTPQGNWGRTSTLVINDSSRLIQIRAYQYSAVPNSGGTSELLSYLLPNELRPFPRRIAYYGPIKTGPPKEIISESSSDSVIYLGYSTTPYSIGSFPSAEALDSALTIQQIGERRSLN